MKILCGTQLLEIDDKYVSTSPYLHTLLHTETPVDKKDDAYIIQDDPIMLMKYIDYIQGKEFTISDDEKEEFLELCNFFSHDITKYQVYDTKELPVKMHDNWVRDNLYQLDLLSDPFYDLEEVPVVQERLQKVLKNIHTVDHVYIAGGAAMYIAGWTDYYKDIDVFFTDKHTLIDLITSNTKIYSRSGLVVDNTDDSDSESEEDSISEIEDIHLYEPFRGVVINERVTHNYEKYEGYYVVSKNSVTIGSIQCILRLYRAPTEIVHGFDIDCCGILYDPSTGKLWCTKRALWSYHNKENIFDPERSSPSYVYRLIKYMRRGFNINIPLFSEMQIDQDAVEQWKNNLRMEYIKHICRWNTIYVRGGFDPEDINENDNEDLLLNDDEIDILPCCIHEYTDCKVKMEKQPLDPKYHILFPEKYRDRLYTLKYIDELVLDPIVEDTYKHENTDELENIDVSSPWGQMVAYMGDRYRKKEEDVDRLFLAKILKVYSNQWVVSDYDSHIIPILNDLRRERIDEDEAFSYIVYDKVHLYIPEIEWKEQNPMEQVTSTFHPQPIPDIKEWLRTSKFLQ